MNNLSDIFLEHKTNVVKFIDGVRKEAYLYGYIKAIDDFMNNALAMIKEEQDTRYGYLDCMDIREIAEQLKAGGNKNE